MSDSIAVISRDRWSEASELLVVQVPEEVRPHRQRTLLATLASDPLQPFLYQDRRR